MITLAATTTTSAAAPTSTSRRRPCGGWMISSSSCSSSETATVSQLSQRRATGSRPQPGPPAPSSDEVGHQDGEHRGEPGARRDDAGRGDQADHGHPQADRPAEENHLAVQRDAARDHSAEAEQGGQVEHVGADDDPRADLVLVQGQGGHRRGDLRCVCRQRGHHTEQRLGQAEPLADPLQPGDQQVAGGQADSRAEATKTTRSTATGTGLRSLPREGNRADQSSRLTCSPPYPPGRPAIMGRGSTSDHGHHGLADGPKIWACKPCAVTEVPQTSGGSRSCAAVHSDHA